jgi:LacI family transcriptional regulator
MHSKPSRRHVLVLLGYNEHDFMRGILRHATEAHWILDTTYNRMGLPPDQHARFDGIVTVVGKRQEVEILRRYRRLPCVDLSGAWLWDLKDAAAGRVARVTYDPAALARMAAQHLLQHGFKTLAFLNTCNGWHERPGIAACAAIASQRRVGFHELRLYRELGIRPPYSITRRLPRAMRWLADSLRSLPKPCGVIVVDDWAPNLLSVCEQAAIVVPEELAIIAMCNHRDVCEHTAIPISAVDADFERIAYEGARLLDRLMNGEKVPRSPMLMEPTGVAVRHSTNVLAVNHREVAGALRTIWDRFREPIQATDVVAATTMSYRGLSLAFQKHLGRTLAAEIARKRVEEARRLLTETELKVEQIATRSGFSGLTHLSRAFKRAVGESPAHYRKRVAASHR